MNPGRIFSQLGPRIDSPSFVSYSTYFIDAIHGVQGEWRLQRKKLRGMLIHQATNEDLLETVEVFKEKYYPGDRVVVFDGVKVNPKNISKTAIG